MFGADAGGGWLWGGGEGDVDVEAAFLDDVEVVTYVALCDYLVM